MWSLFLVSNNGTYRLFLTYVTVRHSAYPTGISCILLTNLATNNFGIFKGILVQIIEKQQYPFVKRGSLGSDLHYIRLQGKLRNFWNIAQKSISTEGFSTIFDGKYWEFSFLSKLIRYRALQPQNLDIGYHLKVGDIVILKPGYWTLSTENGISGYWVHWNMDIRILASTPWLINFLQSWILTFWNLDIGIFDPTLQGPHNHDKDGLPVT